MMRRKALESIGGLDEDYFMYAEEMDCCYRLHQAGWSICYLPEAQAVHLSGGSSRRVPERKRSQLYHSKWLFVYKHRGPARAAAYRVVVLVASVMKLMAWLLMGVSGARRERSRQNVASYRFLLGSF